MNREIEGLRLLSGNSWSLRRSLFFGSLAFTLFLAGIYLLQPRSLEILNLKATDIILTSAQAPPQNSNIVTVAIDDQSLAKYGQWPWPRYRFAQLLEKIAAGNAKSVGIDIIFAERDRTSPKLWQETLEKDHGYQIDTTGIPEEIIDYDIYLANVLTQGPFVLGHTFLFNTRKENQQQCILQPLSLFCGGEKCSPTPTVHYYQARDAVCNYEVLANAAPRSGFLNGTPDPDGVIRRLPLIITYDGQPYPSFALAVLMESQKQNLLVLQPGNDLTHRFSLADYHIPTDEKGNFLLSFNEPKNPIRFSALEILEGKTTQEAFSDKIVLIGLTATGLTQEYPTPRDATTPLLDIYRYALETLTSKMVPIRTPQFPIWEIAFSLVACLTLALVAVRLSIILTVIFCLLAVFLSWFSAGAIYQSTGFLVSPLLPTLSLTLGSCLLFMQKFYYFQQQAKTETGDTLLLLKSSETNLQSILKTIPDIVFRLDTEGNITFISPAISKYISNPKPLLGSSIFNLVAPEDIEKAQYKINERRTGERATSDLELSLLLFDESSDADKMKRYFSLSAEGIYQPSNSGQKRFVGTQGIVRDITKRKQLEKQLLQAQNMEVIGNLAAGIAHDLNNILSGLVSYPDLLLMEIPNDDPLYGKIEVIQRSGKKAAAIVQDLLSLARRNVTIDEICNLNSIITDYLESVEFQRIRDRHQLATIHTNLQENLPNVKGSPVHLSKVIMNLLINALEAMPAGGDIIVSTAGTYVDTRLQGFEQIPEGEYVCTSVADLGVGIHQNDLKRIFEPFFTKKSLHMSGTGLGMTVIWATIKDHKGFIDIKSKEGQGTTFQFYLPTTRRNIADQQERIVLEDYLGSETILVVDDIVEQIDIAKNMLTRLGYTVHGVTSGEKAVEFIKEQAVDLVILDMIMPGGIDGLETYRKILQLNPQQKAIVTSGFSESERVDKLLFLGAGTYVQKPYTMQKIAMAVRKELNRPTGLS